MSDDSEKRIKLDELPDEGSDPKPKAQTRARPTRQTPDPRLEKLKNLDDKSKVESMIQKWYFDNEELSFAWVPFLIILAGLEYSDAYQAYLNELNLLNSRTDQIFGDVLREFTVYIEAFIRHPLVLVVLFPLVFKFKKPSEYFIEISFDGINSVKTVLPHGSKDMVLRTFVKWKEISRVEKGQVNQRPILKLFSPEGKMAEMIWDISTDKKKAIKLILNGLINNKHPMREFLDNEKELK